MIFHGVENTLQNSYDLIKDTRDDDEINKTL